MKTTVRKLKKMIDAALHEWTEPGIEKERVDGWIVERMPGYVSVDNGADIFVELDDKGLHVYIGDKKAFIPAQIAGVLERDMLQ